MYKLKLGWRRWKWSIQRIHGQGMVEFALALPVLLLLVFGIIEGGRLLFFFSSIASASREGARYGAAVGEVSGSTLQFQDCTGIRAAAKRVGVFAGVQDSDITIQYDNGPSTPVISNSCPPDERNIKAGSRILVNVSVPYKPIVPLIPLPSFPIQSQNSHTILRSIYVVTPDGGGGTETPTETSSPSETITPTETGSPTETVTPTETVPACSGNISRVDTFSPNQQNSESVQVKITNNTNSSISLTSLGVSWINKGNTTKGETGKITSITFDGTYLISTTPFPVNFSTTFTNGFYVIAPGASATINIQFANKVELQSNVSLGFNKSCVN